MKHLKNSILVTLITGFVSLALTGVGLGAPKRPDAGASPPASATPIPLPTATPEPPSSAIPRLEAKLKANPSDKETLVDLTGYYLGTGRPDKALPLTQRLLSLGAKTAQVYYLDGAANEGMGKIKEAIASYEQATNLEPTNAQILLTLTNLYMQTNRASDAERVAKRATTFNKDDKRAWLNYGLVLGQEKKYDEARQAFETAAKLDPKDATPAVMEAQSYIDQGAIALALQLYDRALAIDPKNGDAILGRARLLATNHDVKGSIAAYESLLPLLENDDAKAAVLIQEYGVYEREKLTSDAETTIKRALASYPNVAAVHVAYGDFLLNEKKDQAGATAEWTKALGEKRDNLDALQRLGELAMSQNKPEEALTYFRRLAELRPNDANLFGALGQIEAAAKHFDRSRDAYRRSFELSHQPEPLAGVALADLRLRNYKECGQIFDALEKNAQAYLKANPQLYLVMAKCYTSLGQKDKARAAYVAFQSFVKPGSQAAKDLQKMINGLNTLPRPKPTSSPKR